MTDSKEEEEEVQEGTTDRDANGSDDSGDLLFPREDDSSKNDVVAEEEEKKDEQKIILVPASASAVNSTSNNVLDTIINQPRSSATASVVHEKKNEKAKEQLLLSPSTNNNTNTAAPSTGSASASAARNNTHTHTHTKNDTSSSMMMMMMMMEKKRIERIIKYSSSSCTAAERSSNDESLIDASSAPPPIIMKTGLDRQRAGYVQSEPGAYSISGFGNNNTNNNSNSNSNSNSNNNNNNNHNHINKHSNFPSEEASVNTTIPDDTSTKEAPSLSTTTTLTTTLTTLTAAVSTVDRSFLDNPPHEGRRGNTRHDNNDGGRGRGRGGNSDGDDRLIEAELVTVPICATEVVPIDEETRRKMKRKKRIKVLIWLISVVVFVLIISIVSTTTVVLKRKERTLTNMEKYGYDCFNTTTDMISAQLNDFVLSNYTETNDRYTICPGTNTSVESFQQGERPLDVREGFEYPLTVIAPNTVVECGMKDYKSNNKNMQNENMKPCTLTGGFRQVAIQPWYNPSASKTVVTKDDPTLIFEEWTNVAEAIFQLNFTNVTIRGFTFTGDIQNRGNKYGHSVLIDQPGDITLEDCHWTKFVIREGLALVTTQWQDILEQQQPEPLPLPKHSTKLTFRNCEFDNIEYNLPLLIAEDQILVVENCTFTDLSVTPTPDTDSCGQYTEWGSDKCGYGIGCTGVSSCYIQDSCMSNFDVSGNDWVYESISAIVQVDDRSRECGFNYTNTTKIGSGCFSSTLRLLREQIKDFRESNYTVTKDLYLLCPGSKIELGGGCQSTSYSNACVDLGGNSDFPLWVIGPNTTISCGFHDSDDSINEYDEDPCIINGGTQQAQYEFSINKDYWYEVAGPRIDHTMTTEEWDIFAQASSNLRLDNVTIRGITFTGTIDSMPYVLGKSIYIRQPGNITMEDCHWTDMVASTGIVEVTTLIQNEASGEDQTRLPNHSTQLTLRNCVFDNLEYNHAILFAQNQIIQVENCSFANINTTYNKKGSCSLYAESPDWVGENGAGCTYAMACIGESLCAINEESCFQDVDYLGNDWLFQTNSSTVVVDDKDFTECNF